MKKSVIYFVSFRFGQLFTDRWCFNEIEIDSIIVNDIFEIQGLNENTSLVILNRWGQKVFETSNYANDWKGLDLTGEELTEGVYSYFLQTAEGQKEHGFVHLIR